MAAKRDVPSAPVLRIEYWPLERLRPYWRNPRRNDVSLERIAQSLQRFGWQQPIRVDKDGVIIAGHARYHAALALGMMEVPVSVADLSPAEARAYRIVDNSSAELSAWDEGLLLDELEDLRQDFAAELLGFDVAETAAADLAELAAWEMSEVHDEYVLTIRGPLPMQAEVRERLKGMADVTIEASHLMRE